MSRQSSCLHPCMLQLCTGASESRTGPFAQIRNTGSSGLCAALDGWLGLCWTTPVGRESTKQNMTTSDTKWDRKTLSKGFEARCCLPSWCLAEKAQKFVSRFVVTWSRPANNRRLQKWGLKIKLATHMLQAKFNLSLDTARKHTKIFTCL